MSNIRAKWRSRVLDSRPMADDLSRILSADLEDDGDLVIEGTLRPRTLDEYIGQREVKANLSVLLTAARGRGEAADHVLLYGPPGLGKTTLATIIARELGVNVKYASGPAIERAGDLAAILTSLEERDVLFIDEIHRLNRAVEEILYPAMEDYALDVMIGKGPSARSLRLSLKPFTVVGATTRAGRISSPLRDRFGATYRLDFYTEDELAAIVDRSAAILGVGDRRRRPSGPSPGAGAARRASSTGCSSASATTPRSTATASVDEATATAAMRAMEIDDEGLDSTDRKLLAAIVQKFASGPVGVAALAAVLSEEVETIEDVYEPFLLRLGFIDRTPQGRIATDLARAHLSGLGYEIPPPRRTEPGMPGLWDLPAVVDPPHARSRDATTSRRRRYLGRRGPLRGRRPAARRRRDAGTGRAPDADPRRRRDAAVHAGRDERHGQGAVARRHPRDRAPRSSWPTPTTCTCGPGHERIARLGGLHRFMDWDGPILTDSGGFQVVSLGDLRVVDEDGVTFRSHLDGSLHRFTPELAIGVQEALGSDIAVAFDQPVFPSSPRPVVADATERTHRWAERSLAAHTPRRTRRCSGSSRAGSSRTCAPRRPGSSPACRSTASASAAWPATRRPTQRDAALDVAIPLLADDPRPRYLMGLGSPADLLEAVHRGVDLFDSVLPARVARNGQLWVPGGRLNIRNQRFLDDPAPIQDDCPCLACRRFSRAYLAHLFRAKELLAYRLATCHNLTFTLDFMARIRAAIRAGTFPAAMPELRAPRGPGKWR